MTDDRTIRLKRIRFRCWHRGTKEADLILGPFADRCLAGLDDGEVAALEGLLEAPDTDFVKWVTGALPPPPEHDGPLLARIIDACRGGTAR